jgi:hypothetical protein
MRSLLNETVSFSKMPNIGGVNSEDGYVAYGSLMRPRPAHDNSAPGPLGDNPAESRIEQAAKKLYVKKVDNAGGVGNNLDVSV